VELTDEQREAIKALPKLAGRVVLEKVADATASNVECYRRAGGRAKTDNTARSAVHEIMTHPDTVNALAMFDQPVIDNAIATREELLRDLTNVTRTTVADVMSWTTCEGTMIDSQTGEESMYPSIITVRNMDDVPEHVLKCIKSVKQTKTGIELTMEDKSTARKMLIDMQGFNAPTVNINAEMTPENVADDDFLEGLNGLGIK